MQINRPVMPSGSLARVYSDRQGVYLWGGEFLELEWLPNGSVVMVVELVSRHRAVDKYRVIYGDLIGEIHADLTPVSEGCDV